jgi:hypothetical protein
MTTLCEVCSKETGSVACPQCKEEILRLGPYCYLCGAELVIVEELNAEPVEEDDDFSTRVLCTDGACIGVIDERGICKVCGKPYVPDSD